ncbi:carbohydrate ABC transporter permease [Saccharibacillus sp. JS10]|uniref:carbohydrate ABC transporter permease n=1 Tax=Saccharibacillus sp. JS10 TaxID=2950552 RepID=UPI00210D2950|nr:carbohydrate ABC transporter permease [Saccharibacillus sp. JS10]MCQ4087976.1 carbohydrate ABC transporter permease [Saccharibacillus sp. JS10]
MLDRLYPYVVRIAAALFALMFLTPIFWMLSLSLTPESGSLFAGGFNVSLDNYKTVLNRAPIFGWMGNSLVVSVATTALVLLFASMAAYSFSRVRFPGSKVLFILFLSAMMIPGEATLIPLYLLMRDADLLGTRISLILPALAGPMGIFILKQFFDGLPKDLEEAARIDGAGFFKIWYRIFLPLSRPALAALGIFTFIGSWNDYVWPLISISDKAYMTITLGLPMFQSSYNQEYALPMTANALAAIPVLIVFLIFQKQIIKGIAFTGGKEM